MTIATTVSTEVIPPVIAACRFAELYNSSPPFFYERVKTLITIAIGR